MTSDPVRLFEDPATAASLRHDLARATADQVELHGFDLGGGLAALQSATATITSSTTVVAGTSLLAKVGLGAGVAVGLLVLWLGLGGTSPDPGEGERVAAPVVSASAQVERETHGRSPRASEPAALPAGIRPARAPLAPVPDEPQVAAEAEVAVAVDPPAVEVVEPEVSPEPRPRAALPAKAAEPEPEPAAASDGGLREAKLVAKARSNLVRDPERALAITEQAEREFPQGQLVEERRALAIQALVALGRREQANARAAAFLDEYGRGAHAAAVRRAVASD